MFQERVQGARDSSPSRYSHSARMPRDPCCPRPACRAALQSARARATPQEGCSTRRLRRVRKEDVQVTSRHTDVLHGRRLGVRDDEAGPAQRLLLRRVRVHARGVPHVDERVYARARVRRMRRLREEVVQARHGHVHARDRLRVLQRRPVHPRRVHRRRVEVRVGMRRDAPTPRARRASWTLSF